MSDDGLDTEDKSVFCPSFDLNNRMKVDYGHCIWTVIDDKVSLELFLCFQQSKFLQMGETEVSEIGGMMIRSSDKSVREWRTHFFNNDGDIPEQLSLVTL